jgi:preprotein translocase SecE subunit
MFDFFKSSVRELRHVVWPTRIETKKFFIIVLVVLILFGLYLFIASSIFSKTLFGLRALVAG